MPVTAASLSLGTTTPSRRIPLNKGERGFCLVSAEDYPYLAQFNWTLDTSNGYVCRTATYYDAQGGRRRRKVLMHREIMGEPVGVKIDHRNRNRLDNRRDNLRRATQSQNNANTTARPGCTSAFKGVYWHASRNWRAIIEVAGKKKHLGVFRHETDAAIAYDQAALAAWPEFAFLNFPEHVDLYHLSRTAERVPKRIFVHTT